MESAGHYVWVGCIFVVFDYFDDYPDGPSRNQVVAESIRGENTP
jgi:hypothetical protein